MAARQLVMLVHDLYYVLMGMLGVAGTSALVELMIVLLRGEQRPAFRPPFEPEDA